MHNEDLGWARITHPFHPLSEQRFKVLKTRKVAGRDTLILQGTPRGTFAIAREWTDLADPCPYDRSKNPAPILSFQCLLELIEIVNDIGNETKGPGGVG